VYPNNGQSLGWPAEVAPVVAVVVDVVVVVDVDAER
jgi:hypothetical protein